MKITRENVVKTINKIWLSNCFLWWTFFTYYFFFKEDQDFINAAQKALQILPYVWYILGVFLIFWFLVSIPTAILKVILITYPKQRRLKKLEKEAQQITLSDIVKDLNEREKCRHKICSTIEAMFDRKRN